MALQSAEKLFNLREIRNLPLNERQKKLKELLSTEKNKEILKLINDELRKITSEEENLEKSLQKPDVKEKKKDTKEKSLDDLVEKFDANDVKKKENKVSGKLYQVDNLVSGKLYQQDNLSNSGKLYQQNDLSLGKLYQTNELNKEANMLYQHNSLKNNSEKSNNQYIKHTADDGHNHDISFKAEMNDFGSGSGDLYSNSNTFNNKGIELYGSNKKRKEGELYGH